MSNIVAFYDAPETPSSLTRPLVLALVAEGFPSRADDHLDRDLDLHELLIQHPAATFYVRLSGDSMQGAGLYDGDILVVDRFLEPKHHDIVIAVLNGELTVKRLFRQGDLVQLRPPNHRARSEEAKALGVAIGDPYHLNREKLTRHGVEVFSSNYALYGDMSCHVMDTLADHTPEIELYSIDEAFLHLAGFERRGLIAYARQIRATVRRHTGIPVSIGIGPTKTLAKMANHLARAHTDTGGVYELAVTDVDRVLAGMEVGKVWGVGPRWAACLEAQGITTAPDLKHADPKAIRRKMTVMGERLVHELNGRSCLPLELVTPPRKGLTVSRSFGQTLTALQPIKDALVSFVGRAGEKLRHQGLLAGQVLVFVTTHRFSATQPFYANSPTVRLPSPTDFTPDLVEAAARLIETLYRPGFHYQKCGVMLLDLSPVIQVQTDLFDTRDRARQTWLMQALDSLNTEYGARTVRVGNTGGDRPA